jgi:hypothetical protein
LRRQRRPGVRSSWRQFHKLSKPEVLIAEVAAAQHGVVAVGQFARGGS